MPRLPHVPYLGGQIMGPLRLGDLQIGHNRIRVVREAYPVDPIGRFQLARNYQLRLVEGLHHRAVDDA